MTNQNSNKQKQVSFTNMRSISEINNNQLVKMSKDTEVMRSKLESVAKNVHNLLKKINESKDNANKVAVEKVQEQENKMNTTQPKNIVQKNNEQKTVSVRQFDKNQNKQNFANNGRNENRQGQYNNYNRYDRNDRNDRNNNRNFGRNGDNKNGQERNENRYGVDKNGERREYSNNNDYRNRNQNNNRFGNNSSTGQYKQYRKDGDNAQRGNGANDRFGRPRPNNDTNGRPNNGFVQKPRVNKTRETEPLINIDSISQNNKRSFDKKKDRNKSNFDSYQNKKNSFRRGLLEESNIEERIRSNRKNKKKKEEVVTIVAAPIDHAVITTETLTVKQLSEKTGRSVAEILKQLMVLGMMSNVNSSIDFATAELICGEMGVVLEQKLEKSYEEQLADEFNATNNMDDDEGSTARPPIVTVLGHVDHGKTSLLDFIRKTHIQSQEAGGITQSIAAYQIKTMDRLITFIDTPGHAAFSAMRARGASVTDVAILVVAGDEGVKPQTVEAIEHIKQANIPMIVAVNKMDKPQFNIERVKEQMSELGYAPEEWGGETVFVPISAMTGEGVEKLLEMVLLVTDLNEPKANAQKPALGMVIEAKLDKGKGPIATAIILNGTLKVGDNIISGVHTGKVRALINDKGKNVRTAGPSAPVAVVGLDGVPNAGDQLYVVDSKFRKDVLAERKRKIQQDKINAKNAFSMEEFLAKCADSEKKVLNVIVKTDVEGSFEALTAILNQINNEEVRVECIHGGVGAISENDVILAKTSNAVIVGFNSKPDSKAMALAEHEAVKIFISKIIYQISDYVATTIKGMRTPIFEEKVIGRGEVIRTFKISRIGTVAGCIIKEGKVTKNAKIRLSRAGKVLADTTITTLQRNKEDVKEVVQGMDCGIKLDGHNDILVEDTIEAYIMVQVERD